MPVMNATLKPERMLAGLECDRCPNPPIPGKRSCQPCLDRYAARAATRRKARQAVGLCPCGASPVSGKKFCPACLSRAKLLRDEYRANAKKAGTCLWCPAKQRRNNLTCEACAARRSVCVRKKNRAARGTVLDHYGRACACCGETTEAFLAIDHKNNDGAKHRKKLKAAGSGFYRWVIRTGFPDYLQTLCYNCNIGKHRNGGVCPHEQTSAGRATS